jgi:hypothetical protein
MNSFNEVPTNILFSSSYVLALRIEPYFLELKMDFALAPEHPRYLAPSGREQECYARGRLLFQGFRKVDWTATGNLPSHDATGEVDFGSLDKFAQVEGGWQLSGDFGTIGLEGGNLAINLSD